MRHTKPDNDSKEDTVTPSPTSPKGPLTHVSPTHLPPIPFSHIIEADHTSISRLARQTTKPDLPLPLRLANLTTLLWRLVRHDISEEIIMRPAFAQYMGDSGRSFAEQDRADHADLKRRLVKLYEETVERGEGVDGEMLLGRVKALNVEMAEHMKEESGRMLPELEGVLGRETSLELGKRYARTLVLTPDVRVGEGGRCFGDVMEYVKADIDVFRGIVSELKQRAREERDGGYLRRRVVEELAIIGLVVEADSGQGGGTIGRNKEKL